MSTQRRGDAETMCFKNRKFSAAARCCVAAVLMGAAVAFVAALYAQQPVLVAEWTIAPEPLPSPAGANSMEPQLTTEGSRTILNWLERAGTHTALKFAERTASGWSDVRTAAEGNDFMVNAADVPSVRLLADGTLVAQWLQEDGPDPESYKLRLSMSRDAGRTWSAPASPHHDTVQTQHGFASLFQAPGAGLGLVWLDGRAIKPDAPEGVGNMALRAAIFDANGSERPETVVDSRVCECCPTAAAATSEGTIVAYRNRSDNEIRDIYVTTFVNGRWTPPVAVHNDGWRITGCPVNGPAISARGRDVAVAWFTAKDDQGHSFVAFSHDAGRTFGAPVRVDDVSSPGRVGVEVLSDTSAIVSWVETPSQQSPQAPQAPQATFSARRVDDHGKRGAAVAVGDSTGTRYPRLARFGDDVLFAWTATDKGVPRVLTARARIRSTEAASRGGPR